MIIPIVNENDIVIGEKERTEITPSDIYRTSCLWITDTDGNMLLARRALTKAHDPGIWGPAVAGTVEVGETYEQNIHKEALEELGLTHLTIATGIKRLWRRTWTYFVQEYSTTVPKGFFKFVVDPNEVAEVRWFAPTDLANELQQHPEAFFEIVHCRMSGPHK